MPVNFKVRTKIKINGKEYNSPEEMPEDVRNLYERALANRGTSTPTLKVTTNSKITFNGQSYNSVEEMPEEIRRIYESVMSAIDKDHDGIPDSMQADNSMPSPSSPIAPISSQPSVIEPDKSNRNLLILIATLGILILLGLAVLLTQMAR